MTTTDIEVTQSAQSTLGPDVIYAAEHDMQALNEEISALKVLLEKLAKGGCHPYEMRTLSLEAVLAQPANAEQTFRQLQGEMERVQGLMERIAQDYRTPYEMRRLAREGLSQNTGHVVRTLLQLQSEAHTLRKYLRRIAMENLDANQMRNVACEAVRIYHPVSGGRKSHDR